MNKRKINKKLKKTKGRIKITEKKKEKEMNEREGKIRIKTKKI